MEEEEWSRVLGDEVGVEAGHARDDLVHLVLLRQDGGAKVERAVHFADASAYLAPADRLKLSVSIDFVDGPKGSFAAEIPRDFYQVANARTFVVMPDREDLEAQGRGRGISPENTVTFANSLPVNPTRYPDEAIRHKVLDLLGDLALLGQPIVGHIHVDRGTHSVHQELVRDLLTSG